MCSLQKINGILVLSLVLLKAAYAAPEIRKNYQVYRPQITFHTVNDTHGHDASIVYFDGQWIAQWDDGTEKTGQKIRQSMSTDLVNWSKPIEPYSSPEGSSNPNQDSILWQPSLVVKGNTLYSIYKGAPTVWLGKLKSSKDKWVNTPLFGTDTSGAKFKLPQIANNKWDIYAGNNGFVSPTGRIIVPITLTLVDAQSLKKEWIERQKRDSIMYSDDDGATWNFSDGVAFGDGTQSWEATVWQSSPDTLNMVSRNNRITSSSPRENLKSSVSLDNGKTWEPETLLNIDAAMSRAHVIRKGARNIMIQSDWYLTDTPMKNRLNLSLYFSRGTRSDSFVAGLPLADGTAGTTVTDYPQLTTQGNNLVAVYSRDRMPRVTRVAQISPLPDDSVYYVFPRSAQSAVDSVKIDNRNALRFSDDFGSAGIDIDGSLPSNTLDLMFAVKLESDKRQVIFSLSSKIQLVAENGYLVLVDTTPNNKNKPINCGFLPKSSMWSTIVLTATSTSVEVRVGNTPAKKLAVNTYPWQPYFGNDVYSESRQKSVGQKFLVDLGSIVSRVR